MPISIIDDNTNNDILNPKGFGKGYDQEQADKALALQPRRSLEHLFGDAPGQLKIIPRSEWDARFDEQEALQSSLEHIRMRGNYGKMIPSLNQGNKGYCWNHSVVHLDILLRALENLPYVRLSGYANACLIKNYRDEGGWGALAADYIMKHGCPSEAFWPYQSMSRSNDTPEMRENAMSHLVTEDWSDQTKSPYDRNLTEDQAATLLFNNIPYAHDSNDWSHSIAAIRWYRVERGAWAPKIWNSWGDDWEDNGMSVLMGRRRLPDGAVALRVTNASPN